MKFSSLTECIKKRQTEMMSQQEGNENSRLFVVNIKCVCLTFVWKRQCRLWVPCSLFEIKWCNLMWHLPVTGLE